jgi:hypothetical protein
MTPGRLICAVVGIDYRMAGPIEKEDAREPGILVVTRK